MTYLIKRDDALAACEIGPPDEWHMHTKSGYELAANDCKRNIDAVPAIDIATIREAALREAAAAVSELADHAVTALAYEHAHACRDEILDLIGEKK